MSDWLVKLAEKQPVRKSEVRVALDQLSSQDLAELAMPEPKTSQVDTFIEKVAQAEEFGRLLARQHGDKLFKLAMLKVAAKRMKEKKAFVSTLAKGVAGAGKAAFNNPNVALGLGGAAVGAATAGEGNRTLGALGGFGTGYGLGRLGAGAGLQKHLPGVTSKAMGALSKVAAKKGRR